MRYLFVTGGLLALLSCACTTKQIEPHAVPRGAHLHVTLVDRTHVEIDDAYQSGDSICGVPKACTGESCDALRERRCVPRDRIVSLRERKADEKAIAAGLIGGAAFAVFVAIAAMGDSSSTSSTSSNGGGSSSGTESANFGSCPRVYSWNGSSYKLDSGTYGLAYFRAAQRSDFDLLDALVPDGDTYRLRLVNEQEETEHTDLVRLHVVDHPSWTSVVPSADGALHTFRDELRPIEARDFRGKDARDLIASKDDRKWTSDIAGRSSSVASDARDGLHLRFAKPTDAKIAKLRIAAHNTEWAASMMGYLVSHFTRDFPAWVEEMNRDARARAEFEAFLVREGMLAVRVKTTHGWAQRGLFWAAGPEIVKEEAFVLSLDDVMGDTVEIELESATDFWGIDAVALAYGADEPVVDRSLSARRAMTSTGRELGAVLDAIDGARFDTVEGDVAELVFDAPPPPKAGMSRSFVIETAGYYVPNVTPASDASPTAMAALMKIPHAASRLALGFRLGTITR